MGATWLYLSASGDAVGATARSRTERLTPDRGRRASIRPSPAAPAIRARTPRLRAQPRAPGPTGSTPPAWPAGAISTSIRTAG
ncbi:MAG: hypothetical protein MZV64_49540 [Ignavibacteriales bacterium]|nr:hypothetical protein [Ignavibacteriales bacterium]